MTKQDDGGPAFPCSVEAINPLNGMSYHAQYVGMSLRDWFAGQALNGMLAGTNMDAPLNIRTGETIEEASERYALQNVRFAYAHADAMLKGRNNETT